MPILSVNHVSKIYGTKQKFEALHDINFSVDKGGIRLQLWDHLVQVRQPSLMLSVQLIAFQAVLYRNQCDEINQLSNKKLAQFRKKELGFIFQDYSVLPTLTVKENYVAISVQKMKKDEMEKLSRRHRGTWYL